jgi:hypothetical protein
MTVRRMKTYTGATGYVYQYYFVGKRAAISGDPAAPATEFIFDVTADRKVVFAASVFLKPEALAAWAGAHGRALTAPEQYGAAKMRLFQGFDEIENFLEQGRRLFIDAGNIEQLLESLNLD